MNRAHFHSSIDFTMLEFTILKPPDSLRHHVEFFRLAAFPLHDDLAVRACPTGHPEIVFHLREREAAIESIETISGRAVRPPLLFVHGQITEIALMNFRGPFTSIQVVLKPFALQSLFGLDATELANGSTTLASLAPTAGAARELEENLIAERQDDRRVGLLGAFLNQLKEADHHRDHLIEESITLIARNISTVTVKLLLERIGLSERQFERRFIKAVGIAPQLFIRIRRVNEAFRLMDTGMFERLSDVAYALNFYDQSHFIREVKTFSGITPKDIAQKVNDFHHDLVASSYRFS